jgi:cyclophilin family peptidyl-prolyl cis-trans isomerase
MKYTFNLIGMALLFAACASPQPEATENTQNENTTIETEETMPEKELPMEYVVMETSMGDVTIELDPNKAPATVANFLSYVDDKFYDGTIFHRVIPNFMVQGGGFTPDGDQKQTKDPIVLESQNGLKNNIGSIAMARTNSPNSATCQFFINVTDNDFLNYSSGNPGYAVFGKVTTGMDVINQIRQVPTGVTNGMRDWPKEDVVIKRIYREESN